MILKGGWSRVGDRRSQSEPGWFSIPLFNMLFSMDDLMKAWFQERIC